MSFGQLEQESLLAIAAFDDSHSAQALTLIPEHLFDAYQREMFLAIESFRKRFGEAPGTVHMLDLVESLERKFPDKAKQYAQIYASMSKTFEDGINVAFVFSRAEVFGRFSRLRNAFGLAIKELQSAKEITGEVVERAEKIGRDALSTNIEVMDLGVSSHEPEQMMRALDAPESETFSTGIPELDKARCCPARKRLFVIEAKYGAGKSFGLQELMLAPVFYNKLSAAYITLENSEEETVTRNIQNIFGVGTLATKQDTVRFNKDEDGRVIDFEFETIDIPSVKDSKDRIASELPKLRRRAEFRVKGFPTNSFTATKLEALLDAWAAVGFHPAAVIVDYARLMKINNASMLRQELGQHYVELRGVATDRNIAVVTAAQLNREGADGDGSGANVAEDISVNHTADQVVVYKQTPDERKIRIARLEVHKNRGGPDAFEVLISQSYAKGMFVLDSALMHADYSSVLEETVNDRA
jgi:hypothetical protein